MDSELVCFHRDIHNGHIGPDDQSSGPALLREYLGKTPDDLPLYSYVYAAYFSTLAVCLLLDIKPRELQDRAIKLGWIRYDAVRGLQEAYKIDPETCFYPVGFYYEADPDEPESHARYKRTIADAYWDPDCLDFLGFESDKGGRA